MPPVSRPGGRTLEDRVRERRPRPRPGFPMDSPVPSAGSPFRLMQSFALLPTPAPGSQERGAYLPKTPRAINRTLRLALCSSNPVRRSVRKEVQAPSSEPTSPSLSLIQSSDSCYFAKADTQARSRAGAGKIPCLPHGHETNRAPTAAKLSFMS